MKRAEMIAAVALIIPIMAWFASFVLSSYQSQADVSNIKEDISEIKKDTNYIRNYLLERKTP